MLVPLCNAARVANFVGCSVRFIGPVSAGHYSLLRLLAFGYVVFSDQQQDVVVFILQQQGRVVFVVTDCALWSDIQAAAENTQMKCMRKPTTHKTRPPYCLLVVKPIIPLLRLQALRPPGLLLILWVPKHRRKCGHSHPRGRRVYARDARRGTALITPAPFKFETSSNCPEGLDGIESSS